MSELETKQRNRMRRSTFAYVDRRGEGHLPLNDESHVRNAVSRFNQTEFESQTAKESARKKILRAANRYDIEVGKDSNVRKRNTALRAAHTKRGPRGGRKKS
jgi:hypothetical protein